MGGERETQFPLSSVPLESLKVPAAFRGGRRGGGSLLPLHPPTRLQNSPGMNDAVRDGKSVRGRLASMPGMKFGGGMEYQPQSHSRHVPPLPHRVRPPQNCYAKESSL